MSCFGVYMTCVNYDHACDVCVRGKGLRIWNEIGPLLGYYPLGFYPPFTLPLHLGFPTSPLKIVNMFAFLPFGSVGLHQRHVHIPCQSWTYLLRYINCLVCILTTICTCTANKVGEIANRVRLTPRSLVD